MSTASELRMTAAACRVMFTWFGVRKAFTPEQRQQAAAALHADADMTSASKKILDTRHPSYRALTEIKTRIRQYWRSCTLPYPEPGVRLLRLDRVEEFNAMMAGFSQELRTSAAELNVSYPAMRAAAEQRLGQLFNAADYPNTLQGLFAVEWEFPPIEPPDYLRQLNPTLYEREQARIAARFDEAVSMAEQAFAEEFGRLVSRLAERLTDGPEGRRVFRDSSVERLTEFFDRFRALNVNSNQDLDALVQRAQDLVQDVGAQDLRDDAALRQHIATEMGAIAETLETQIITGPRRRILGVQPVAEQQTEQEELSHAV